MQFHSVTLCWQHLLDALSTRLKLQPLVLLCSADSCVRQSCATWLWTPSTSTKRKFLGRPKYFVAGYKNSSKNTRTEAAKRAPFHLKVSAITTVETVTTIKTPSAAARLQNQCPLLSFKEQTATRLSHPQNLRKQTLRDRKAPILRWERAPKKTPEQVRRAESEVTVSFV